MVGEFTGRRTARLRRAGMGRMWIARGRNVYTYPGEPWGFDNGAYRDWVAGVAFDEDAYRLSLAKAVAHPDPPFLAVLPDVPAKASESLAMSDRWLGCADLPWYLAVQDGMTPDDVRPFVGHIVGLFLGGTTAFKATLPTWVDVARAHGLRVHYGRCSTPQRIAQAIHHGCESADSTTAMWKESRWSRLEELLRTGPQQTDLFLRSAA